MTAPSLAAPSSTGARSGRAKTRGLPPALSTLPIAQYAGVGLVLGFAIVVELLGRPAGVDPAVVVPVLVVAATAIGGYVPGAVSATLGITYIAIYYAAAASLGLDGALVRVLIATVVTVAAVWVTGTVRLARDAATTTADRERRRANRTAEFTKRLTNLPDGSLPEAVVRGLAEIIRTDMAVLTVLDPQSGRHFVRAVHGGAPSAIGVEVVPGVGVTGQALRDRKLVVGGARQTDSARDGGRRAKRRADGTPQIVAALPLAQQGRVIATVTIGRSDPDRPFDADDFGALDLVSPVITLAISSELQRQEVEQGSPRDSLTGLYNRAYLDAALDQLLALRRRSQPHERPPLSMIMFDIDSFQLLNERHGRQVGDAVLRAVATLLRQRFRASDIPARVGPDSFFVVLNGAPTEIAAEAAAQIRRQVRELNIANARGEPVVVSVSAGCAAMRDGENPDALFRSVEAALSTARWSGPGAVVSL
jgi:diguanylate cyclase (GGDEF)-like protein